MSQAKSSRLLIMTLGEWGLVLPATLLLAAAALRQLQPRLYEPSRTSWLIFEWATTHISRLGAGLLFIGLPGLVAMAGCMALLGAWREDQTLRQDASALVAVLRRQKVLALLVTATLVAGAILAFAVTHVITD